MKINFRNEHNLASAHDPLAQLFGDSGSGLLLSSGYFTAAHELPLNQLLAGCSEVVVIVGHWSGQSKAEMEDKLRAFAEQVTQESDEFGFARPTMKGYVVPHWHAKIAFKFHTDSQLVSTALIGSSNISESALAMSPQIFNIECDVLLDAGDGPDAGFELGMMRDGVFGVLANYVPLIL